MAAVAVAEESLAGEVPMVEVGTQWSGAGAATAAEAPAAGAVEIATLLTPPTMRLLVLGVMMTKMTTRTERKTSDGCSLPRQGPHLPVRVPARVPAPVQVLRLLKSRLLESQVLKAVGGVPLLAALLPQPTLLLQPQAVAQPDQQLHVHQQLQAHQQLATAWLKVSAARLRGAQLSPAGLLL